MVQHWVPCDRPLCKQVREVIRLARAARVWDNYDRGAMKVICVAIVATYGIVGRGINAKCCQARRQDLSDRRWAFDDIRYCGIFKPDGDVFVAAQQTHDWNGGQRRIDEENGSDPAVGPVGGLRPIRDTGEFRGWYGATGRNIPAAAEEHQFASHVGCTREPELERVRKR